MEHSIHLWVTAVPMLPLSCLAHCLAMEKLYEIQWRITEGGGAGWPHYYQADQVRKWNTQSQVLLKLFYSETGLWRSCKKLQWNITDRGVVTPLLPIFHSCSQFSNHYRCSLVSAGSNSSHHRSWSPRALQAHRSTSPFLCLAHMWVLVHICENWACIRCHCKNLTWIAGVTLLGSISWLDILGIQTWLKTLHCGELRRNNGSRIWGRGWRIGEGRWKR